MQHPEDESCYWTKKSGVQWLVTCLPCFMYTLLRQWWNRVTRKERLLIDTYLWLILSRSSCVTMRQNRLRTLRKSNLVQKTGILETKTLTSEIDMQLVIRHSISSWQLNLFYTANISGMAQGALLIYTSGVKSKYIGWNCLVLHNSDVFPWQESRFEGGNWLIFRHALSKSAQHSISMQTGFLHLLILQRPSGVILTTTRLPLFGCSRLALIQLPLKPVWPKPSSPWSISQISVYIFHQIVDTDWRNTSRCSWILRHVLERQWAQVVRPARYEHFAKVGWSPTTIPEGSRSIWISSYRQEPGAEGRYVLIRNWMYVQDWLWMSEKLWLDVNARV